MDPITVTTRQARAMTGLGKTKLFELIGDGTIESTTIGRRRLVSVASLKRLLAPGTSEAGDAGAS